MLEQFGVDAHHQHLLIIGAIEDADMPAPGQRDRRAPQEIVIELELARRLEGMHVAALRIDAGHHVLDDAVLAGGVQSLEDDEDRVSVLGIEPFLQGPQPLGTFGEHRLCLSLVEPALIVGVDSRRA